MNKALIVFGLVAALAAGAFANKFNDPSLPVTEIPNARSWKQCFDVGKYGTVCGIVYVEPSDLSVGGRVTWDGNTIFDYKFSANKICASEQDLLKLVELIPALAEFKPIIDTVISTLHKIPAKVLSICLSIYDVSWSGSTLKACAKMDITLICWLGKCAYKNTKKLGCFTI